MDAVRAVRGPSDLDGLVDLGLGVEQPDQPDIALDRDDGDVEPLERVVLIQVAVE